MPDFAGLPAGVTPPTFDTTFLENPGIPHDFTKCCFCGSTVHPVSFMSSLQGRAVTFWRCKRLQCFQRQLKFVVMTDTEILFLPTPIQCCFFEAVISGKYLHILFGGAKMSSKSYALRWLCHWLCLKYPNFRVIMLRRTKPEGEKSQLADIEYEAKWLKAKLMSDDELKYPNGSIMTWGVCAKRGDESRLQGAQYDLVIFDEQTLFEIAMLQVISTCARRGPRTPVGWRALSVGGTNPGGVSGEYCSDAYRHKAMDPVLYPHYDATEYLFIEAMLEDNPYVDTPEYDKVLRALGPIKYKAWRLCDWDAESDPFFHEWRKQDEQQPNGLTYLAHVITSNEVYIPRVVERFVSMDWGQEAGVAHWWACLINGTFIIEDEFFFGEVSPIGFLIAQKVAQEIQKRNRRFRCRYVVASHDMWRRSGQTGEDLVETFRKEGLTMMMGSNDRKIGWQRFRALLAVDETGMPWMRVIGAKCPYLCRTLPRILGNSADPDDIIRAPKQADHAVDSIRYGAMSRPYPTATYRPLPATEEELRGFAGHLRYELDSTYGRRHADSRGGRWS